MWELGEPRCQQLLCLWRPRGWVCAAPHPVQPASRAACLLLGAATVVTSVGASSLAAGQGPGEAGLARSWLLSPCTCWRFLWARVQKHCGGEMGPGLHCEFLSREVVRAEGGLPTHHGLPRLGPWTTVPAQCSLVGQSAQGPVRKEGAARSQDSHILSVTDFLPLDVLLFGFACPYF